MHDAFNRKLKVKCLSSFDPVLQNEARNCPVLVSD